MYSLSIVYFVCLFVCLGFSVPLQKFYSWRRHHYRWRASNFDIFSKLMAIEQWVFFSVLNLLWHGTSVYNGHLQETVTLPPVAELLTVQLLIPVFTTKACCGWDSNTQPSACEANALNDWATTASICGITLLFIEPCLELCVDLNPQYVKYNVMVYQTKYTFKMFVDKEFPQCMKDFPDDIVELQENFQFQKRSIGEYIG